MTQRFLLINLLLVFILSPAGAVEEDAARVAAQQVAERYGLANWERVEQLSFTFQVQLPGKEISRSWVWFPQTKSFRAGDSSEVISLQDVPEAAREVHAQFINDEYWLVFPFHLVWDSDVELTLAEEKAPISGKVLRKLTVQYTDEGGYTPGDAYDLYLESDYRIVEWVYRKGGVSEPTRMSTWEDEVEMEGLIFSRDHRGPEGFRVWFTGLTVVTN